MVAQPVPTDGPRLHRCRRRFGRIRRLDRGSLTRAPERTRTAMPKPKPEKKPEMSQFAPLRVLPMELRIGDRLADQTGEWEVISRPYASAGGKLASAHVRKVGFKGPRERSVWLVWMRKGESGTANSREPKHPLATPSSGQGSKSVSSPLS